MNTPHVSVVNIKIILVLLFFFGGITHSTNAQVVYEHISNTGIYDYLDEMANLKIIELNNVVKPYSREFIYSKLTEIARYNELHADNLNKRQQKDLAFYQTAYALEANASLPFPPKTDLIKKSTGFATALNPVGLFYKDSVFTMALQPILGTSFSSNANGGLTHTWSGAGLFGYIGKNLGFYTNVRDNNESRLMIAPGYLQRQQGVPVKNFGDEGVDYTEARGGITYAWKWGTVGLVKDHIEWGLGYNGTNIQSGHTPSFAMIKLQLKPVRWGEFNYYHGSLVSEVIDSARSYWSENTYRVVYFQKYMAANMFTLYPIKHLNFSFGNSIVYTNESGGGPHAAYLIPFLFYKSVDLTLSSNDKGGYSGNNNHFFFNISSRNIKHLHLYFSLFADDISFSYFKDKDLYNSFSYKLGFRLSDFPIRNLSLTAEYTLTNPYVYQHHTETQNYTSNSYNMGHYLRDNAEEYYFALKYIPIRGLAFEMAYSLARHGDDYSLNDPNINPHSDPILKNIIWQNRQLQCTARYEIVSNTWFFASYTYQDITGQQDKIEKFTPEYYRGTKSTVNGGLCIGF